MATTTAPKTRTRMFPIAGDLPENTRERVTDILNRTLASTLDLKTQVKQAHWNVKGKDFYQLHELFDEIAAEIEEFIDEFAERATALGGTALGTVRMSAESSILPDYPAEISAGEEHLKALVDRFELYAKHLREQIDATAGLGDADTSDLYTGISRDIDKRLWFLKSHLL